MKKIYVTVAEFLENGGELTFGRMIFNAERQWVGTFIPHTDRRVKRKIYINTHDGVVQRSIHDRYVQIDCNPIYK